MIVISTSNVRYWGGRGFSAILWLNRENCELHKRVAKLRRTSNCEMKSAQTRLIAHSNKIMAMHIGLDFYYIQRKLKSLPVLT